MLYCIYTAPKCPRQIEIIIIIELGYSSRKLNDGGVKTKAGYRSSLVVQFLRCMVLVEYGPDTPLHGSSWISQISISDATKTEVCLLLFVEFWVQSETELNPPLFRQAENMRVQPQIRLVYSTSGSSTRLTLARHWMYRLSGVIQVLNQSSISLARQGKVVTKKYHIPLRTGPSNSTGSNLFTRLLNPGGTASCHLNTVQLLDTCLFDVALLKQWLMGCADLHGNECKKNPTINLGTQ
ncbi:unnamed protein product [Fusarium graminearum]|uniref:Uncharacterized protein n=1 Tax=Gibberella zeae TaxID=5518 RepID=A0A9N8RFX6_GIBZA|nr:unnamed protein product [Fusarium graminearum]